MLTRVWSGRGAGPRKTVWHVLVLDFRRTPQELEAGPHTGPCSHVVIAVLVPVATRWKQSVCQWRNRLTSKVVLKLDGQ